MDGSPIFSSMNNASYEISFSDILVLLLLLLLLFLSLVLKNRDIWTLLFEWNPSKEPTLVKIGR